MSKTRPAEVATLSTQSIPSSSPTTASPGEAPRCSLCGAPLAPDQRYCLECGERQMPRSEFLFGDPRPAGLQSGAASPPSSPPTPPTAAPAGAASSRNATLTALAGIGLLLLAMGVGVLIGRSGGSKQAAPAAQVITVGGTAGSGSGTSDESSFTSDWPAGTSGYTVQLETLPQSGTSVSAVAAAKAKATAKGATGVGALKSEEFASLTAGQYVIYSGDFPKKAEAEKAREALVKSFPGATVIDVSSHSSSEAAESTKSNGSGKGVGETPSKPAPPSVLNNLHSSKGKSYEEKSKNLPDVVETG